MSSLKVVAAGVIRNNPGAILFVRRAQMVSIASGLGSALSSYSEEHVNQNLGDVLIYARAEDRALGSKVAYLTSNAEERLPRL